MRHKMSQHWFRFVWRRRENMSACHYNDVIMGAIASHITSLTSVYSIVYSDADQRKHQSSESLAFVRGIHRGPVNSPYKWAVTRKRFPYDDVIMALAAEMRHNISLLYRFGAKKAIIQTRDVNYRHPCWKHHWLITSGVSYNISFNGNMIYLKKKCMLVSENAPEFNSIACNVCTILFLCIGRVQLSVVAWM